VADDLGGRRLPLGGRSELVASEEYEVMDPRTDAEVIACSFKSPASFGELFERHATTMFRYFVRRVGPDDADSLLGERRTTVVPLDSGSAFEFAERLEFLEIGCDDPYLEVAALVCNCPRYLRTFSAWTGLPAPLRTRTASRS
jgi:hypothetical protein